MNQDTLNRLIDLVGKTGDKVVVTDPAGEKPYVLMSLDQYENLMNGASEPKKAPEPPKAPTKENKSKPAPFKPAKRPSLQVAEDLDPPVALKGMTSFNGQKKDIPLWKSSQAPPKPAPQAPVAVPAQQVQESESEEQFYLEPLE